MMGDELDRQREIEERKFKREVNDVVGTTEVKVQRRKVIVIRRVSCPKQNNKAISLEECGKCEDYQSMSMDGKHVHCKLVTQEGRAVVVFE